MNSDTKDKTPPAGVIWPLLLLLISVAPLPFGSNRPWAWSLLSLLVALLLGGWAAALLSGRRALVWRPALIVPVAAAVVLTGWIGFSIIPSTDLANPVWQMASETMRRPLPFHLALSVDAALTAWMRLATYAAIFWLSVQYCRESSKAQMLLVCGAWAGLAFAVYGLANYFAGNDHILWYLRWNSRDDLTSTFVNRNHYATFAGLGILCSTALAVTSFRAAWQLSDRSQKRFARTIECMVGWPLAYLVVTLVIATAWLQTHSRMGGVAVILGVATMFLAMMAAGLVRWRVTPLIIVSVIIAFLFAVSGGETIARLGQTSEIDRMPLFSVVGDQIASAPLTGSGYGSFAQAFLIYRDQRLPTAQVFLEAHNSYLELAAELGIPMASLLIAAIAWCAGLCLVGMFRRQRAQTFPIVALAATIVVGVHALADFSVQLPAVAGFYAALLGMGVAQSWSIDKTAGRRRAAGG